MKRWFIGFIALMMICMPMTVLAEGEIQSFSATATEDGAYIDIVVAAVKDITGASITKDGAVVGSPGNIGAGDSWNGGCAVDESDAGKTVKLKLTYTGSDGESHSQTTKVKIPGETVATETTAATTTAEETTTATGTAESTATTQPADGADTETTTVAATTVVPEPAATVSVSASDTRVKQGENVKLTYVVTNTGNVALNYVELSEPSLGKISSAENVQPGEKLTFTYTIKNINQSFESKPRLAFVAGGKTQAVSGNTVDISVATAKMTVTLAVSKSQIDSGEAVELTGKVTNRGDIEFKEVVISEKTLGELARAENMDYGDSKSISKEVKPEDSVVYQLVVTAKDNSGKKYTYSSKSVTVKVEDHPVPVTLDLTAQTDTVQLSEPGMVSFSIDVDNISNRKLENVVITDQNDNTVQAIQELPNGSMNIQYECMVNETTDFIFTATVKDGGVTSNFHSAPVKVTIAEQESAVVGTSTLTTMTESTLTTIASSGLPPMGNNTLTQVLIGIVVVIAIVITALIALVIYGNSLRPESRRKTPYHTAGTTKKPVHSNRGNGSNRPAGRPVARPSGRGGNNKPRLPR